MKRVLNDLFLDVIQPMLVGLAIIAILTALLVAGGVVDTAFGDMFQNAVDEISSQI